MRALITGITGFAGQHLTEHLIASGDQVLGSTHLNQWTLDVAPNMRRQVRLFEWDIAEPISGEALDTVRQFAPDCIYHLAAISVPAQCGSSQPGSLARKVNVEGTAAVIQLARSLDMPARVLFVSSAHVYAPVSPENPVVSEESPLGPTGGYGKTKLQAEEVCQQAIDAGMDIVIARAFQHSGPRQLPMFMLPEWAQQFAAPDEQPIRVVTLDSCMDLSDVRDVVRAYRLLVSRDAIRGIYNVGRGKSVRSRDVFDELMRLSGQRRQVVQRSPGFRQHPIADISRLVRATQWSPRIPLERTIADTLASFQARVGHNGD